MKRSGWLVWFVVAGLVPLLFLPAPARPLAPVNEAVPTEPPKYDPHEPLAKTVSLAKAAEYLDTVAAFWMRDRSCGRCHTNYSYLMARPLLKEFPTSLVDQTRRFVEQRIADKPPARDPQLQGAQIVTASLALTFHDAQTTGKLPPATRRALDKLWASQRVNGTWLRLGCGDFPAENDRYFLAEAAALAVSTAPDAYARDKAAGPGMAKLRAFLSGQSKSPANLYHRTMLLWASLRLDGLMQDAERRQIIAALVGQQRVDGGWSFVSLQPAYFGNPQANLADLPSDGYATGLVVYVLRQAGFTSDREEIRRGVNWLKTNQRASGRWFTFAPDTSRPDSDTDLIGTRDIAVHNVGTAFAVMALRAREHRFSAAD
jgi:squalene-hopene/tetraprenyl-beta-curcumene cyclase